YAFTWSRFHDVLTLAALKGASAGYFAAKPWRRIGAPTPTALSQRCPPPAGALRPTGAERATPSPDASIRFSGALVRTAPETWHGDGHSAELGRGRLTIRGPIVLSTAAVRTRLTFTARFAAGELRGCAISFILRRPH